MWVYLLILLIPIVLAFRVPGRRYGKFGFIVFYLTLWLFTGLRYEVGPDWTGYWYMFQGIEASAWSAILDSREPGFFLIGKIASVTGLGLPGVNAICAALFLFGLYRFSLTTANPWLATAAVTPFLVFVVSMSGIRQAAAIGLVFTAMASWRQSSLALKVALIVMAASIHNSAALMLIFVIWGGGKQPWIRVTIGVAFVALMTRYLMDSGAAGVYAQRYLVDNIQSGGAIFHVALSAFPAALFLVFQRQIKAHGWDNALIYRASILSLALIPLVFLTSTGASRLSLYFSFVQMWAFPAFVAAHGSRWTQATWICNAYFLAVFLVYFNLGSHAFAYLPYRNVILEWATNG